MQEEHPIRSAIRARISNTTSRPVLIQLHELFKIYNTIRKDCEEKEIECPYKGILDYVHTTLREFAESSHGDVILQHKREGREFKNHWIQRTVQNVWIEKANYQPEIPYTYVEEEDRKKERPS